MKPGLAAPALAARLALVLVALGQLEVGVWGEAAPRSFFDTFPGAGHHWLTHLGPYNEHLVRDYAAAELGLGVLLLAAAIWFAPRVVLIAGASFLFATVPHFAYHLTTTDRLSSTDNVASLAAFAVEIALVVAAMAIALRTTEGRPHATLAAG
jgi:hypothetical protein